MKHFPTIGATFVTEVSQAKSSDELFKTLCHCCRKTEKDPQKLAEKVASVDLPHNKSVANFKATVYRIQIDKRHKEINNAIRYMNDLNAISSYISRYIAHEQKFPKVTEYTVIAMSEYLNKGFGDAASFKQDLYKNFDVHNHTNPLNKNLSALKGKEANINRAGAIH